MSATSASCSNPSASSDEPSASNDIVLVSNNPVAEQVAVAPKRTKATKATRASTARSSVDKRKRGEKKKGKQRSDVWDHFTKEDHPLIETIDGVEKVVGHTKRAQCKYCPTHLACNSYENGTSSLRKHIEIVCKGYLGRVNVESGQQVLTSDGRRGGSTLVSVNWSQDNCVEAATHMIVVDELAFSFIEKPGFRYFCSVAMPLFKVPCRKVIVKTFLGMYDAKKEELRRELKSHCVCLTTDTWTSCQNINYMVITAHFIDRGWQMHKRVLAFCVVPNHLGVTIGKILEKCLIDWSIDKVLTISVDNASANKHAIDYLRKKMCNWDTKPICGGKFMHVRCLAHIVNLIVRSGLNMMERSVASIRNAVRYVRSSGARLDEFKSCVEQEKVECNKIYILDVPTRWNSTFLMLDTALELKKAFERLKDEEDSRYKKYFDENEEDEDDDETENQSKKKVPVKRVGPPSDADWNNAAVFVKFLKVFYDVTLNVSASLTPTTHKAFHDIVTIEAELEDLSSIGVGPDSSEADNVLYNMAVKMKAKYSKYFGNLDDLNQLFLVALVLDPRYKLRNISWLCDTMLNLCDWEIKKKCDDVKQLVVDLCDLYGQSNGSHSGQTKTKGKDPSTSATGTSKSRSKARILSGKRAVMQEDWNRQLEQNNDVVVGHEVDRYLLDPIEKPAENDDWKILDWWKLNGGKYPNLQSLARDILAIQVSTVASESSFSTGRRIIDPYRSSLNPKTVEKLICLQNWLKADAIMGLEYIPTMEEMESYEQIEADHEKEDREKAEKAKNVIAAASASAPSGKTTKSSEASASAPTTKKKRHKK